MKDIQKFDSQKWLEAMKSEMESMKINGVWTLVDPSEEIKPTRCKWIFKIKREADGKVEIYKVHLVANGYCQRYVVTMMRHSHLWEYSNPSELCLQ